MDVKTGMFYVFSAVLLFAGARVITARSTVHAALFLVLAFFSASCVWILLRAEFLAISLVLVYVGAVMVLFLFVVMMLDINFDNLRKEFRSYIPVGATVGVLVLVEMALTLIGGRVGMPAGAAASRLRAGRRRAVRARGAVMHGHDSRVRHASAADAKSAIGGYTVLNDISVRDFQNRTLQFLQGKTFYDLSLHIDIVSNFL